MREDRQFRQLAMLQQRQRQYERRLDDKKKRLDARFDRARQRITSTGSDPSLEQQRIVNAALELLDEVGLNELSLRKLAAKLDLKAPALYWYFKSKEVLIDYMAEAILQAEFKDLKVKDKLIPWEDWLIEVCKRLRKAMNARRDGARIVAGSHPYPGVALMKIFETSIESLIDAGLDPRKAYIIIGTAIHLTFGRVIEEQSSPEPEDLSKEDMIWIHHEFPRIAESLKAVIEDKKNGHDGFEESLRLFVGNSKK